MNKIIYYLLILTLLGCNAPKKDSETKLSSNEDNNAVQPATGDIGIVLNVDNITYKDSDDKYLPLYSIVDIRNYDPEQNLVTIGQDSIHAQVSEKDLLFAGNYSSLLKKLVSSNSIGKTYLNTVMFYIHMSQNKLEPFFVKNKVWYTEQNSFAGPMTSFNFDKDGKFWVSQNHQFVDGKYEIKSDRVIIEITEQDFYSIFKEPGAFEFEVQKEAYPNPALYKLYSEALKVSLYYSEALQLPNGLYTSGGNQYVGMLGEYNLTSQTVASKSPDDNNTFEIIPQKITIIGKLVKDMNWFYSWVAIDEGYTDLVWVYIPDFSDEIYTSR